MVGERWTILPVIRPKPRWWFPPIWTRVHQKDGSCRRLKALLHFSVKLHTKCCAMWRSTWFLWCWCQAALTILMTVKKRSGHLDLLEKAYHVQCCEQWQQIVQNEQLISWGSGQFGSKCTSAWSLVSFSFVTHTDNCFGETLQLETSDQTNKIYWQLRSHWRDVGGTTSTFHGDFPKAVMFCHEMCFWFLTHKWGFLQNALKICKDAAARRRFLQTLLRFVNNLVLVVLFFNCVWQPHFWAWFFHPPTFLCSRTSRAREGFTMRVSWAKHLCQPIVQEILVFRSNMLCYVYTLLRESQRIETRTVRHSQDSMLLQRHWIWWIG